MSKILVTGGAGFIGSHIVDTYIAAGHEVAVVDDLSMGQKRFVHPEAQFFQIDIRDPQLVEVFAQVQPEYVNHLAAQIDVRRSVQEPVFDAEVNILGSINLVELVVKHRVKKFLFASTGGAIYGEPAELPASEDCPPNPKCHYAASKLAFEHYLQLYHNLYQLTYTILRFPNVYGPRQNPEGEAGVCSILSGLMLRGQQPTLYGHGTPLRDYVYVGDIARANLMALDQGDNRVINLGSGQGTSVRELFDTLARIIGFDQEPKLAPIRPGEVQDTYITGALAEQILQWKPETPLEDGLREVVAFVQADEDQTA